MFYTYTHCYPDGAPFYVGAGSANRAYCITRKRHEKHYEIIKAVGAKNVRVEIFPCGSMEEAFKNEQVLIAELRAAGVPIINVTNGGRGPNGVALHTTPHSDASKDKCRVANLGKRLSPETEFKPGMVGINRGKTFSPEVRARMSEAAKRRFSDPMERLKVANSVSRQRRSSAGHYVA